MKKSSKILGSIALSAALVMGTAAPAFAFDGSDTTDGTIDDSTVTGTDILDKVSNASAQLRNNVENGASTVINASTYTSQLSVTIPLTLPLKFDTVGGTGMAPSDGTYYIQNNSSTKIGVKQADYKVIDKTMWALGTGPFADSTSVADASSSAPGFVGDFYLGITPVLKSKNAALKTLALAGTTSNKETGSDDTLNWGINPGQKYGFSLAPSSSKLNKSLDTLKPLASITYTVGVSTAGTTNMEFVDSTDSLTPSDGVSTVAEAKTHVMNATGLGATFGTNVTYIKDPATGNDTTGYTGTTEDVSTGEWQVVAINYYNINKYVPYTEPNLVSGVAYQVVVKAPETAPAAPAQS